VGYCGYNVENWACVGGGAGGGCAPAPSETTKDCGFVITLACEALFLPGDAAGDGCGTEC
jgi:hypothetical protein